MPIGSDGSACDPCADDDSDGIPNQEDCDSDCLDPSNKYLCCSESVEFIPNSDTHYNADPSAFTLLPGDRDSIEIVLEYDERDAGEGPVLTISNQQVAVLWENDKAVESITLEPGSNTVTVLGLNEGSAWLRIDAQEDSCDTFPVIVGGRIEITYARPPGIVPAGGFQKWTSTAKSNDHPGNLAPLAYQEAVGIATGGGRELHTVIRTRIVDALGDPKPKRPVRFEAIEEKIQFTHSRGDRAATRSIIINTNGEGYADARAEAASGMGNLFSSNQLYENESILITFGESANEFRFSIEPNDFESIRALDVEFYSNRIRFGHNLSSAVEVDGDYGIGTLLPMPVINEPFVIILENWTTGWHYDVSSRQSIYNGIGNNPLVIPGPDGVDQIFAVSVFEHPFAETNGQLSSISAFDGQDIISVVCDDPFRSMIDNTYYDPNNELGYSWSNEAFSYIEDVSQPSLGSKLIDIGTIVGEFAIAFVPGGDAKDLIEQLIWKPISSGQWPETEDYLVVSTAAIGLAADLGYLAGPTGFATNAIAGGLKVIIKYVPMHYVTAIWRLGPQFCATVDALGQYLVRYPTSQVSGSFSWTSLQDATSWAVKMSHSTVNSLIATGRSSLNIAGDAITKSWNWSVDRAVHWLDKDAAEGAAHLIRRKIRHNILDDLVASLGLTKSAKSAALQAGRAFDAEDVITVSDEALLGLGYAAKGLTKNGNINDTIINGKFVGQDILFKNVNKRAADLTHTDMVRYAECFESLKVLENAPAVFPQEVAGLAGMGRLLKTGQNAPPSQWMDLMQEVQVASKSTQLGLGVPYGLALDELGQYASRKVDVLTDTFVIQVKRQNAFPSAADVHTLADSAADLSLWPDGIVRSAAVVIENIPSGPAAQAFFDACAARSVQIKRMLTNGDIVPYP
ncbi:MAG: hypothetical protein ACF8MJ_06575 [Phycisphaerales bacterium JB050]